MVRSSNVQKPRSKAKKPAAAGVNNHRFETFTSRLARLKFDPLVRNANSDSLRLEGSEPKFKESLDQWSDLNLSENFVSCRRELKPLCESLAQLVHHKAQIADILTRYLEKRDEFSLEPLLKLVPLLAFDLQQRFQAYFQVLVKCVADIAATHASIEVIEWSFECLAFLFKFMSTWLVRDLRPCYDLMAPYLGKEHQKHFISRFAAEAMSSLVKKAGGRNAKDSKPLKHLVAHVFQDLQHIEEARSAQYCEGLAFLFAESIKGVGNGIDSRGIPVAHAVIQYAISLGQPCPPQENLGNHGTRVERVVEFILTNVIHETDASGFTPVMNLFLDILCKVDDTADTRDIFTCFRLITVVAGVRQGTRVSSWPRLLEVNTQLLKLCSTRILGGAALPPPPLLQATAVLLQYAPLDAIITPSRQILDLLDVATLRRYYLGFCLAFENLGRERFNAFFLPHLQSFIDHNWQSRDDGMEYEEVLCWLLPMFRRPLENASAKIHAPEPWQQKWADEISGMIHSQQRRNENDGFIHVVRGNQYLGFALQDLCREELQLKILDKLLHELRIGSDLTHLECSSHVLLTMLVKTLFLLDKYPSRWPLKESLRITVVHAATLFHTSPLYLKALQTCIHKLEFFSDEQSLERLAELLVNNLAAPSHDLRLSSLELLQTLREGAIGATSDTLQVALAIERTQPTFENIREISKDIRKLAAIFDPNLQEKWLLRAMPFYCFGLCHIQLTPIWNDVAETLHAMCQHKEIEESIVKLAVTWLQADQAAAANLPRRAPSEDEAIPQRESTDFQCTNLMGLDQLFAQATEECHNARERLIETFENDTRLCGLTNPACRLKSLMLLCKLPHLVEKRSRSFVEILLNGLAGSKTNVDNSSIAGEKMRVSENGALAAAEFKWDVKSRSSALEILSKFVNPAVVFRTEDVYQCLLATLCNGDSDLQKKALNAVLAWKPSVTRRYRENLLNLLDDARFREELAIFLDVDSDETSIEAEHRPELLPILLRLLYGRIVDRSGTADARRKQGARRKAVLLSVARIGTSALQDFIAIALGPLDSLGLASGHKIDISRLRGPALSQRTMLGITRLIHDILSTITNYVGPLANNLLDATLFCYIHAAGNVDVHEIPETANSSDNETTSSKTIDADMVGAQGTDSETATAESADALVAAIETTHIQHNALTKSIRQQALDCLSAFFDVTGDQDWSLYMGLIVDKVIRPRLPNLPIETAQGVSGILRLISTWCSLPSTAVTVVLQDNMILDKVVDILDVPSAQNEVKVFALANIVKRLFSLAQETESGLARGEAHEMSRRLTTAVAPKLIASLSRLIEGSPSKDLLHASIQSLIAVGETVKHTDGKSKLLGALCTLLKQPLKVVAPAIKADILRLLSGMIPNFDFQSDTNLFQDLWSTLSVMFSHLPSAADRKLLVSVFILLGKSSDSLAHVAQLCSTLNAFSQYRAGEPDYDRRSEALFAISDVTRAPFSTQEWEPLLHNMVFLIKDNDELSMRSNASLGLQRFVEEVLEDEQSSEKKGLMDETLVPVLQRGMREHSELIKAEYLAVLTKIIRSGYGPMKDMMCLTGPDEESAFFNNVLHLQQHRRLRSLKTLGAQARNVSSTNISRFCMPLLEMYTTDEDVESNLLSEAISTLGLLAESMEWPQYRALAQRTTSNAATFQSRKKIRALNVVLQALTRASAIKSSGSTADDGELALRLATSLPDKPVLRKSIQQDLLPKIQDFIHYRDEATVDLRVMATPVAVQLVMLLDADEIAVRLPSILIDLCNILRSKAQEARDDARKTLAEVAAIMGPYYFKFILKQMRSALDRGSRLHVLSYTCHSLMVSVQPVFQLGDLDHCTAEIMDIIMTDVFGSVGLEKDAEGYVSKMKEVRKKNLGYDTAELLASMIRPETSGALLTPVTEQLAKVRPKLDKVDELMRRIREGIRANKDGQNQQWLILCYQIIQGANSKADPSGQLISPAAYKMAAFGWELLRRVLDKHEVLKTAGKLQGFLPLLNGAFSQNEEEVQSASVRVLTSIIKVPLDGIDQDAENYIKGIRRIVEHSSTTNAPLAQTALRLLAALIRERPYAIIKKSYFENHIAYIISRIKPDLDEPGRSETREKQVAAFNLLKAVLNRGVLIKEVYEIMETVRQVMITSHDHQISESARSVYARFVLDYFPEGGKGLGKQLDFIISNLQYANPEGRQSVMDVLSFVISRKDDEAIQPVLMEVFLPLVIVMASDTASKCRESALTLLGKLFERASKSTKKSLRIQLQKWLDPSSDLLWQDIGMQCWGLYLNINRDALPDAELALARASQIIAEQSEATKGDGCTALESALELFDKLCSSIPSVAFSGNRQDVWTIIPGLVQSESFEIQALSAKLFKSFLAHLDKDAVSHGHKANIPLTSAAGLQFTCEDAVAAIEDHTSSLQSSANAGPQLTKAIIDNLAFVGRLSAGAASSEILESLLSNVASAVRQESSSGSSLKPRLAALGLLQSLCKDVPLEHLRPAVTDILHALNNLTDKDIPKATSLNPNEASLTDDMTTMAHETLSCMQQKLGPQDFVTQMQLIKSDVRERREERRAKRRIDAVAQPARAEKVKQRKHELSKNRRREKNNAMAGRRRGY